MKMLLFGFLSVLSVGALAQGGEIHEWVKEYVAERFTDDFGEACGYVLQRDTGHVMASCSRFVGPEGRQSERTLYEATDVWLCSTTDAPSERASEVREPWHVPDVVLGRITWWVERHEPDSPFMC